MKYCYVVTCEVLETFNAKVSGCCYHDFKNAVRFIESRSDKPKKVDEKIHLFGLVNDGFIKSTH